MMTDERRRWLRGAYLDRIHEAAMHFAEGRTHFVDSEWLDYIADEFDYLSELTAEDHAYLRDQAGLEAFRRIVAAQSAAHDAAVEKFRADNADVVNAGARFAMDTGWFGLLQHAAARIRTYPSDWRVRIDGGKEKFGCCVVFIDCDYSARGCRSEVERLLDEIRLRSLSMCEICGELGRLRLSGWAKTVCDKHAAIMGEFRDDDGRWADPWKWHEDQVDVDLLKGMDPPIQRSTEQVIDSEFFPSPIRATDIGRRVDDDTWSRSGREQELLIEFGFQIIDAVQGACVKEEYLDGYVRDEIDQWRTYALSPLTESDAEFLHEYIRGLINEEYERIRIKQQAERADRDN